MQVVLNKNVPKLGYRGDVVKVKEGYYRNFLLPRGFADICTPTRLKVAESRKDKLVMEKQQVMDNAKEVLKKLEGLTLTFKVKVTEKGTLYAAINESDVIAEIKKVTKVKLERDQVKMAHFKELGEHKVVVHLGKDLEESVKVVIEAA